MGKKSKDVAKNIRKALLNSARMFIQEVAEAYSGLEYTRAVDTYIMENIKLKPLKIELKRDGRSLMSANLLWVSQNDEGDVVLYLENKRYLYPNTDNVKSAVFVPVKKGTGHVEINTSSETAKCFCGKPIEIFDESDSCPSCGVLAHAVHLKEWVQMKGNCPSCGTNLLVRENGEVSMAL
ncbi:MAG: hypothetical protein ACTSUE_19700 [Promethearchaeota archaeon]